MYIIFMNLWILINKAKFGNLYSSDAEENGEKWNRERTRKKHYITTSIYIYNQNDDYSNSNNNDHTSAISKTMMAYIEFVPN